MTAQYMTQLEAFRACPLKVNLPKFCYLKVTSTSATYTSDVKVKCEKPNRECYLLNAKSVRKNGGHTVRGELLLEEFIALAIKARGT